MTTPSAGARFARVVARVVLLAYPASFRSSHAAAFTEVAEDRWHRERASGRSALGATIATTRVLLADTVTGARVARRDGLSASADDRRSRMIDRGFQYFRLALRGLVRAPLVTLVATASLAVGIGANTAVYSAGRALLFAPLPGVADADRVVDVCRSMHGSGCDTVGYQTYLDYRDRMTSISGVYAARFEPTPVSLGSDGGADLLFAREVSASYFRVLGVTAAAGRFFSSTDERAAPPLRELVLSHHLWRDRFRSDRGIVGRTLELNGDRFAVVGVADAAFDDASIVRPDMWVPLTSGGHGLTKRAVLASRESLWLVMGARLAPGATLARVRAEGALLMADLQRAFPDVYGAHGFTVEPSRRLPAAAAGATPFFALLMGLVGTVLIVACANIAGVLLARGSNRIREFALRRALGASRGSLIAMCVVESLVLFAPGFALAFVVARIVLSAVGSLAVGLPVPINTHVPIDWRVVAFTTLLGTALALVTAILPAWQTTSGSLVHDLKQDSAAPRRQRLRRIFVATQVAFCLAAMAVGALLFRAAHIAASADPGFQVAGVDVATVDLSLGRYTAEQAFDATEQIERRLAAIPGVRAVAASCLVPLEGSRMGFGDLRRAGTSGAAASIDASWSLISPEYLPTLGIPIVRGRNFTAADRAPDPRDVIVNEHFAATIWPNADPIGQRLEMGDFRPGHADTIQAMTVVGVARDASYRSLNGSPTLFIYLPLGEYSWLKPHLFIAKTPAFASEAIAPAVRQALAAFDRSLPLVDFVPLQRYATLALLPQRIAAAVAGLLGTLALVLAAMGLYGLTAFWVRSRTREIGIRVALGAGHGRVLRLIVWQSLRTAAIGAAIGLALALVVAELLASALYGMAPADPVAFGLSVAVVIGVALVATYLPARRAATIDPSAALRVE